MTTEINKLQEFLKDLKDRLELAESINDLNTKYTVLKDSVKSLEEHVKNLNTNFTIHMEQSQEYSSQIQELQNQIEVINTLHQNLPNLNNYNLDQMEQDIQSLKTSAQTLSATITALKGNSSSTLEGIDAQIESINTQISTINSEVEDCSSQASTLANDISTLKTTTQNHTTNLNNLTSSTNNLTSTVSNINSRLSSAERELSAITGGVDLTELDERVTGLESGDSLIDFYTFKYSNLGYTPSNFSMYTKEYTFYTNINQTLMCFELNYTSNGSGILTVDIYHNNQVAKSFIIDLSLHPTNCRIYYQYTPTHKSQTAFLKMQATSAITYENMIFSLFGKNVKMVDYWKEFYAVYFGGYIYLTRFYDDCAKYGKFSLSDDIDLENLPNTISYSVDEQSDGYLRCYYMPYPNRNKDSSAFIGCYELLVKEGIDGKMYYPLYQSSEFGNGIGNGKNERGSNTPPSPCVSAYASSAIAIDGIPYSHRFNVKNSYSKVAPLVTFSKEWLAVYPINKASEINGECISGTNFQYLALNQDGYFYITYNSGEKTALRKIAKGSFATLYRQADNSRNMYIVKDNITYKYNDPYTLNTNIKPTLMATIEDCDCVFELADNKILKHVVSTNSWIIEALTFLP